jgi:hypothetical protein
MIILPSNVKFYWFRNLFLFAFPFFLLRWDLYEDVEIIYMTWILGLLLIESHSFLDFWKKCLQGGRGGEVGEGYVFMPSTLLHQMIFFVPLICACEASPHSRTTFADFNFPNCPTSWWSSKSCALELKSQQDTLQEINLFLFASNKLWVSTCFCTCMLQHVNPQFTCGSAYVEACVFAQTVLHFIALSALSPKLFQASDLIICWWCLCTHLFVVCGNRPMWR